MNEQAQAAPQQYNLMMGILGGVGGALVMGIAYGVVGMVVAEFKYIAIATGAVSGLGAVRLGGGQSLPGGIVAAVATLIAMLLGKLLIQPPEGSGITWIEYHTYLFDILFCYVGAPVTAFATAGTPLGDKIREHLPI